MGAVTTRLIVNADDFGYSKGVNQGIIEAFRNGIVTSTTMMANMPGAADAAALAKEYPELGVGVHLVLTMGKPVSGDVPSLVNENGRFYNQREIIKYAKLEDVEKEYTAQIEKFLSFGLIPTHIDSHHGIHEHEAVLPLVLKLASQYNLPIRSYNKDNLKKYDYPNIKTTDIFIHDFYGDNITIGTFKEALDKAQGNELVEIMCHPAFVDKELLTGSSYNLQRVNELSILTSPELKEEIKKRNIEYTNYRQI